MAKAPTSTAAPAPRMRLIAWIATHDRERGEKTRLGQRRHGLDLGVAKWMIGVGGLVGFAHGEEGEGARPDVDRVMRAFREKRERAGGHARRRA